MNASRHAAIGPKGHDLVATADHRTSLHPRSSPRSDPAVM